jgi:Predicted periplasmic protein
MAIAILIISSVLFTYVPKDEFYRAMDYSIRDLSASADHDIVLVYPSLRSEQKTMGFNVSDTENSYQMNYYWNFDGNSQSYRASVPKDMYEYYRGRPHGHDNYQEYALSDYDREVVRNFAKAFQDHGNRYNYSDEQVALNIISFVNTLPYTYDLDSAGFDDYPRYPVETLVEGGDCEDRAILVAALLYELNQKTILIRLATHVAIGLEDNGNYTGQFYESGGVRYYYAGVATDESEVGIIPPEINPQLLRIHPVTKIPSLYADIYRSGIGLNSSGNYNYTLQGTVTNEGPGPLKNASLRIVTSEIGYNKNASDLPDVIVPLGDLPEDSDTEMKVIVPVPRSSGLVTIYIEGDDFEPFNSGGFYFNFAK